METRRYTAVAIVLHWAIAFAIAFMIPLGFWMHEAIEHSETIVAATRRTVEVRQNEVPLDVLSERAESVPSRAGRLEAALAGGPERHHEKTAEQGKLPVRERVERLVDPGSFAEEAALANWDKEGLGADGVGWMVIHVDDVTGVDHTEAPPRRKRSLDMSVVP